MNVEQVVESLKDEANKNPVAKDVFYVLATRKRARQQLTVTSLANRMKAEGFRHQRYEYAKVFEFLADLDLGKLIRNQRGRVSGLSNITVKLQSIGLAGYQENREIEEFVPRKIFKRFPEVKAKKITPTEFKQRREEDINRLSLEVTINGKKLNITIPDTFTADDLADFIRRLKTNS